MDMETTLGMPQNIHKWMMADVKMIIAALEGIGRMNDYGEAEE